MGGFLTKKFYIFLKSKKSHIFGRYEIGDMFFRLSLTNRLQNNVTQSQKGILNYVIYSLEEEIEKYERKTLGNNPFTKMYASSFVVYSRQVHMNIAVQLEIKLSMKVETFEERYGSIYSSKGLQVLLSKKIITQQEYNQYIQYSPKVSSLIDILEKEGSLDNLLKSYFPEKKGANDGSKQALEDYLVEMIEVLDPRDIPDLLYGLKTQLEKVLKKEYSIAQARQDAKEIYELYVNIDEIVAGLDEYKKAYYKSYVGTTLSLAIIPASRFSKAKSGVTGKKSEKMEEVEGLKRQKNAKVKVIGVSKKITERMDHVMKFKFIDKLEGRKYDGGHSLNEMKKGDYQLEILHKGETKYNADGTVNTKDYPYRGTVKVKDENGNWISKSGNSGDSSFFPDSWDRKRIAEEVGYAIENNKGYYDPDNKEKGIVGKSKDGSFWIRIQMSEDGKISSFFPDFENKTVNRK